MGEKEATVVELGFYLKKHVPNIYRIQEIERDVFERVPSVDGSFGVLSGCSSIEYIYHKEFLNKHYYEVVINSGIDSESRAYFVTEEIPVEKPIVMDKDEILKRLASLNSKRRMNVVNISTHSMVYVGLHINITPPIDFQILKSITDTFGDRLDLENSMISGGKMYLQVKTMQTTNKFL